MTQPQFKDGPPVPLLVEGTIDPDILRRLFSDLESAAVILGVREKAGTDSLAAQDDISLDGALERLLTGAVRAVQVRYRFAGHDWADTIFALLAGFRVIRCRHERE